MTNSTATLDFNALARDINSTRAQLIDTSRELVPAEAHSRMQREGNEFLKRPFQNGATVDQEGLNNNYAVEPPMYAALFPSPEQARQYAFQAAAATVLIVGLIVTSVAVS